MWVYGLHFTTTQRKQIAFVVFRSLDHFYHVGIRFIFATGYDFYVHVLVKRNKARLIIFRVLPPADCPPERNFPARQKHPHFVVPHSLHHVVLSWMRLQLLGSFASQRIQLRMR